ncbi:hypothetical protein [Nostoc sp. ChiQUE01b]|uniref:hypothetical protein n=1 Tax=Nostoc sp. ChiQUE01b TaxID=3075376 RepID=UPI002AD53EB2|nr:hypothetical protein [Nostoc sp. ChiQUE01b]MDZ8263948.1 hypothetical protein [Nostoc sp. ChiQUE01b]
MDKQLQHIPNNQFLDISPVTDIIKFIGSFVDFMVKPLTLLSNNAHENHESPLL